MMNKHTVAIFIVAVFAAALSFGAVSHADAAYGAYGGSDGYSSTCCTTTSGSTGSGSTASSHTTTTVSSGYGAYGGSDGYSSTCCTVQQTPTYTSGTYTTGGGCSGNCGGGHTVTYPAPTCNISVSQNSITNGQSITVSWNSNNATYGNISNVGNNLGPSGSFVAYPQNNTTYTGTFYGQNGQTVNCSASVVVTIPQCPAGYTGSYPNCYPPVQYCPSGYTGTYPNCYPPQTYNNPSCSISINNYGSNYNNGYYQPNTAVTISWNSANASYGSINNGLGSVGLSGTRTVYPMQTTTYTGTFYGQNGQSVTCSATVNVQGYVPPVYPTTPYVTLSAVPYTGLDLGPVGTVVYWGFLALWCLLAAYLIAVKRVQTLVYASLMSLLFGVKEVTPAAVGHTHSANVSYIAPAAHEDKTDDFIVSQINRVRA